MMAVVGNIDTPSVSLRERRRAGAGLLEELEDCVTEARRLQEYRNRLIIRARQARVPVVDIARSAHLSRRTVYRIINSEVL